MTQIFFPSLWLGLVWQKWGAFVPWWIFSCWHLVCRNKDVRVGQCQVGVRALQNMKEIGGWGVGKGFSRRQTLISLTLPQQTQGTWLGSILRMETGSATAVINGTCWWWLLLSAWFFASGMMAVLKLDLGHVARVYSLNSFGSHAAPSAVYLAVATERMFSTLDFRGFSKIQTLVMKTKRPLSYIWKCEKRWREVIDRKTEEVNWGKERKRTKRGNKEAVSSCCCLQMLFISLMT